MACSLLWLRLDLRLADNPALAAALNRGGPLVPVFVWSPNEEGDWPPGGASKWWLHQSLAVLDARMRQAGSRLILRRGPALETLRALAKETGATAVFWNRRYEPTVIARDTAITEALRAEGLGVESFNAALLHEPWTIQNQSGKPFQVFTPFWKHCLAQADPAEPLPTPKQLPAPPRWPKSLALDELGLEPRINWADGLRSAWQPGETGAAENLRKFLAQAFEATPNSATGPTLPARRAFHRICTSVRSVLGKSGTRCGAARTKERIGEDAHVSAIASWTAAALCRFPIAGTGPKSARGLAQSKTWRRIGAPRSSWPNWVGVSLRIISSITFRTRPSSRCGRSSRSSRGGRTPHSSRRGRRAARVIPSWTPGCENCGPRAGCTIACE
jgi:hypothetical protein